MINVEKVKKGFGKCWKFFAAKPAYAGYRYVCIYCGQTAGGPTVSRRCSVTGGRCVIVRQDY